MIALQIKDIKNFMSHLLINDTFDSCSLSEAAILAANTFQISGEINKEFFSEEELNELSNPTYSLWSQLKPVCYSLIKGNKTPTYMKYVFILPVNITSDIITQNDIAMNPADVNGLFINIKFSEGALTLVTGSSIRLFTLDKSLDMAFDKYIKNYLNSKNINFEEI